MRPRVFPAEDPHAPVVVGAVAAASMRPRVFPAEDDAAKAMGEELRTCFNEAAGIPRGRRSRASPSRRSWLRGFNEAAGIPRGRRFPCGGEQYEHTASMRPRVFPAEDIPVAVVAYHVRSLQ